MMEVKAAFYNVHMKSAIVPTANLLEPECMIYIMIIVFFFFILTKPFTEPSCPADVDVDFVMKKPFSSG